MDIIRNILLVFAYTLGISTLIVQFICYKKKVEYKETIVVTISFLMLIIATTIQFLFPNTPLVLNIKPVATPILLACFSVSIVFNSHKERVIQNSGLRNILTVLIGLLVIVLSLVLQFSNSHTTSLWLSAGFLFISVEYSMLLVLFTKPAFLLKETDSTEKRNALVIAIIMLITLLTLCFTPQQLTIDIANQHGAFIFAGIAIFLSISKLSSDVKKLSKFTVPPTIEENQLKKYQISPRESDVAKLLAEGKSYREIAEELYISLPTVKTHVTRVYEKLNVKNRHELTKILHNK
ncbi:MAG TPA: LuxR C-terminal-related transcriptional regulator [Prolixibacteraceae bacterium]|nr:LuxR C-terminal-related transcriptional regulator [Prolixibacteraceae bacterium]